MRSLLMKPVLTFSLAATRAIGFFFLFSIGTGSPVCAEGDFLSLQKRLIDLYEENKSAILRVKAAYEDTKTPDDKQLVIGSGFFISREGHILTNASIVLNPQRIWIEHNGVEYDASLVGFDAPTNLALLRAHSLPPRFNFLRLSDDPHLPPPGTLLLRISAPLDFEPSPSLGIVGGHESRFGNRFFPCAYIRANIPAGPGDGGGAFLDLSGKLVGLQVGSLPELSGAYLLPVRAASRIYLDLIAEGEVTHSWIGFEVERESSLRHGMRLKLSLVLPGTPAASAGMKAGDELRQVGTFTVKSLDDLRNAMFYTRVGQYIPITVRRDEKDLEFNVRLVPRPPEEPREIIERLSDPQTEKAPIGFRSNEEDADREPRAVLPWERKP
jgi:serine protease Do